MQTYNVQDDQTQLLRLVERAANGEAFIMAMAGKPMVKVIALALSETCPTRRFGFMAGQIRVPVDFDYMGDVQINEAFSLGAGLW